MLQSQSSVNQIFFEGIVARARLAVLQQLVCFLTALLRSPNEYVFDEGCYSRIDGFPFGAGL